jgi:hypothetical protein
MAFCNEWHMALEAFCFGLMIYLYPRLVLAFYIHTKHVFMIDVRVGCLEVSGKRRLGTRELDRVELSRSMRTISSIERQRRSPCNSQRCVSNKQTISSGSTYKIPHDKRRKTTN